MRKTCECKDLREEMMEEQERFNEYSRFERKLNKLYEAILDIQDRMAEQMRCQREEELKIKQQRIEDEKISLKMWDYDYTRRQSKMKDFNEEY